MLIRHVPGLSYGLQMHFSWTRLTDRQLVHLIIYLSQNTTNIFKYPPAIIIWMHSIDFNHATFIRPSQIQYSRKQSLILEFLFVEKSHDVDFRGHYPLLSSCCLWSLHFLDINNSSHKSLTIFKDSDS